MILAETPRRQRVTKLVSWGHWFAFFNILIAIVIASSYIFNSRVPETGLGIMFMLVNWVSHIGFLTFIGFVLFILPLCYLIPNAKLMKGLSSTLAAIGLALLAFDALLYTKYGLHLSFSSASLIRDESAHVMAKFSALQWGYLGLLFVVWLSFQLLMANALWKRIERFQQLRYGMPISMFFLSCFMVSHISHIWADATLYQPIIHQDDMFPLSYPATAKTLMSKNGLLDLQNYEQRKLLQLDRRINDINYPSSPLYCAVEETSSVVLLIQTDSGELIEYGDRFNLASISQHYDLSSNLASGQFTTLFGLPELYQSAMDNVSPVLLDIPQKLGLEVSLYGISLTSFAFVPDNTVQNWSQFQSILQSDKPKLAIGFVTADEMAQLLNQSLFDNNSVYVSQFKGNAKVTLLTNTNQTEKTTLTSHQDLAPTLLNQMGCNAPIEDYTTGQDINDPLREWMIATQGNKIVLINYRHRIEVDGKGNYKLIDFQTGEESLEELNISLLSQGIKHLSRFSK